MTRKAVRYCILGTMTLSLLFLLFRWETGRRIEAAGILADLAAGEKQSLLKTITPTPTRTSLTYRSRQKLQRADLYRPGDGTRAGILLIPGAAELGKDDPRLVSFASTLARAHFTVLVPDLEGMRNLLVESGNIQEVTDSFAYLATIPGAMPHGNGGICAFSYAVGPAILASLSPPIRDQVCFIISVGGYHNLPNVLTFFTTGYFREKGRWRRGTPNEYGKWFFVLSNAGRLSHPRDRQIFQAMGKRKMADLGSDVDDVAAKLGPEGRLVYEFITNSDPSRMPMLISNLPKEIRGEIAALDLAAKDLSPLRARLILVHGLDDDIIPYTESKDLADAAPPGQAELHLVRGLFHVDLEGGFLKSWQLSKAVMTLLRARDRWECPDSANSSPALLHQPQ